MGFFKIFLGTIIVVLIGGILALPTIIQHFYHPTTPEDPEESFCGNDICEEDESTDDCPSDCINSTPNYVCGNRNCEIGEDYTTCPTDCEQPSICGNGLCEEGETTSSCQEDCHIDTCASETCGNRLCNYDCGETKSTCKADCGSVCGNKVCESDETTSSCQIDCRTYYCGDGSCNGQETKKTCQADCCSASYCGNDKCDADCGETYSNCNKDCETNDYTTYFANNPKVRQLTLDQAKGYGYEDYFWQVLNELDTTGTINADYYQSLMYGADVPDKTYNQERKEVWTRKVAHAVWVDKNNKVSWKLEDQSRENLVSMLQFTTMESQKREFYNPDVSFDYIISKGLLKSTKEETLYAIIKDLRTNPPFIHGASGQDPIEFKTMSMGDLLTKTTVKGKRISWQGCHTMSAIIVALAQSVNIPSYFDSCWFASVKVGCHASAMFPDIGVLNHGDDIYSGDLRTVPHDKLLMEWDYFNDEIVPCGREDTESSISCRYTKTTEYNEAKAVQYAGYPNVFGVI